MTVVETPHPVKDGYKSSEAVQIPGAKKLILYFDRRCASQNDYDKLVSMLYNISLSLFGDFAYNGFTYIDFTYNNFTYNDNTYNT